MTDKPYQQWLAECREVSPPATLADDIMIQVARFECHRQDTWWLRVIRQIEQSRAARWAVYGGTLASGSLPFVYLARVAQL